MHRRRKAANCVDCDYHSLGWINDERVCASRVGKSEGALRSTYAMEPWCSKPSACDGKATLDTRCMFQSYLTEKVDNSNRNK